MNDHMLRREYAEQYRIRFHRLYLRVELNERITYLVCEHLAVRRTDKLLADQFTDSLNIHLGKPIVYL